MFLQKVVGEKKGKRFVYKIVQFWELGNSSLNWQHKLKKQGFIFPLKASENVICSQ